MSNQQLQQLITELQSGNDRQRRVATYKLGKSKEPTAVPALISAYNDSDSSVRQNVIEGLYKIGSKEALDFLSLHGHHIGKQKSRAGLRLLPIIAGVFSCAIVGIVGMMFMADPDEKIIATASFVVSVVVFLIMRSWVDKQG